MRRKIFVKVQFLENNRNLRLYRGISYYWETLMHPVKGGNKVDGASSTIKEETFDNSATSSDFHR